MLPYIAYMDPMMFGNSVWMLLRFQVFLGVRNGGLFFSEISAIGIGTMDFGMDIDI
jgi:anaerobic C4-dicarboxylate transporter